MRVALTRSMSLLQTGHRSLHSLLLGSIALLAVACGGEDTQPGYASTDIDPQSTTTTGQSVACDDGAIRSCTIWLGRHGDLANCIHGVDICTEGAWSGCIDEGTLADNPELYSELVGADGDE